MIINVDDLIPRIGYALAELVDGVDWRSVLIKADLDEDYQEMMVSYEDTPGTSTQVSLRDNMPIWDELAAVYRDMWNRFSTAGEPWKSSTFRLLADGNVSLKFEYANKAGAEE